MGEGGREGEKKASESQAGSGGGVGLRPKGGGVRIRRGEAGGGSLVAGQGWERQVTAVPGKKGHWRQLSAPILESNCGPERGGDLPKVTQGAEAV